jgi:hypothetical protein
MSSNSNFKSQLLICAFTSLAFPLYSYINSKQKQIQKYKNINSVSSFNNLLFHFKYLSHPKHRLIILNNTTFNSLPLSTISILSNIKNSKLLITTFKYNLINNNIVYVYYPPKLPFVLSAPELYTHTLSQNKYLHLTNPFSILLHQGLYRNEYQLNKNTNSLQLAHKGIIQLAETNKSKIIQNITSAKNKHLIIYIPSWNYLNDSKIENILYEKTSYFHTVNITTSKKLMLKYGIYDNTTLSDMIPQIVIIDNDNIQSKGRKLYSISYLKTNDSFKKFQNEELNGVERISKDENEENIVNLKAKDFYGKVVNNKKFDECIIEIYRKDCPGCVIMGKMYEDLGRQLKKDGIKELKLFKMDIEKEECPMLGEFNATPTFVHIKKNNNKEGIQKVDYLDKDDFISKMKRISTIPKINNLEYNHDVSYAYLKFFKSKH